MSQHSNQNDILAFVADRRRFDNNYSGAKFQHQQHASQHFSAPSQQSSNNYQQSQTQSIKKPDSSYYCTNYKINGHSIERCFKIHGFPHGFKSRERNGAAFSQNVSLLDQTNDNADGYAVSTYPTSGSVNSTPPISMDQYTQLIELLGKQNFF